MRTLQKILLVSTLSLLAPLAASAQSVSDIQDLSPEDRRTYMESMSEDERKAFREQRRSEFESLSDQEKQAMRDKRAATRGDRGRGLHQAAGDARDPVTVKTDEAAMTPATRDSRAHAPRGPTTPA